jgi:hypothetical protein
MNSPNYWVAINYRTEPPTFILSDEANAGIPLCYPATANFRKKSCSRTGDMPSGSHKS